jgi:hypothetical protein
MVHSYGWCKASIIAKEENNGVVNPAALSCPFWSHLKEMSVDNFDIDIAMHHSPSQEYGKQSFGLCIYFWFVSSVLGTPFVILGSIFKSFSMSVVHLI